MATKSQTVAAFPARSARQKQLILVFSRVWAWVFLAALIALFAVSVSIQSRGDVNFLTIRNSQNILMAIVPVLLMGLGQTFVVIAAGIDLSVGWIIGLSSVVSALVVVALTDKGTFEPLAIMLVRCLLNNSDTLNHRFRGVSRPKSVTIN
jgi:ribose/xylose/arabinose/galactoside ABC-type transport system permease subunit